MASYQEIFFSIPVEHKLATQDCLLAYATHTYAIQHNKQSSMPAI